MTQSQILSLRNRGLDLLKVLDKTIRAADKDPWQVLAQEIVWPEYDPLEQNYIYGNTIDEALAFNFVVDGQTLDWRYVLHDPLYSPVALMSEAGAIRSSRCGTNNHSLALLGGALRLRTSPNTEAEQAISLLFGCR